MSVLLLVVTREERERGVWHHDGMVMMAAMATVRTANVIIIMAMAVITILPASLNPGGLIDPNG